MERLEYSDFGGHINLVSLEFPNTTSISGYVFSGCTNLKSVSFPLAETTGPAAFYYCLSLTDLYFPVATSVRYSSFTNCTSLETANFPEVTGIGFQAFMGCTNLENANFPIVENIGHQAFCGCINLDNLNTPELLAFYDNVFQNTGGKTLTITLNNEAPEAWYESFNDVNVTKNVIIRIPFGSTSYGTLPFVNNDTSTENWGNVFRGMGWNGSFMDGDVNPNINLTFVEYP